MPQLDLFAQPHVPSNREPTSRAAAASMTPHVGRLESVVLEAIRASGEHGMTGDEIEVATGLSHQCVGPRLIGIRNLGLVQKAIDERCEVIKRPTRTKRLAIVWVAYQPEEGGDRG